jgi:hypothetical protein
LAGAPALHVAVRPEADVAEKPEGTGSAAKVKAVAALESALSPQSVKAVTAR